MRCYRSRCKLHKRDASEYRYTNPKQFGTPGVGSRHTPKGSEAGAFINPPGSGAYEPRTGLAALNKKTSIDTGATPVVHSPALLLLLASIRSFIIIIVVLGIISVIPLLMCNVCVRQTADKVS